MNAEPEALNALKNAFAAGELSALELEQRLAAAIETEYNQEQPRISFINACEDLLWEIRTEGHIPFVSQAEADEGFIRARIKPVRAGRSWPMWLKAGAVAAAMLVMLLFGTPQLRMSWITGESSKDEEQYILSGHEVDLSAVQTVIADHEQERQLTTECIEEVVDLLGFSPVLPDVSALDVQRTLYSVNINPDFISLDVLYERDPEALNIVYAITWYNDAEYAYYSLEQSKKGSIERISGQDVYAYMNYHRPGFVWSDGLTVHVLSGGMSRDEGRKLVQSILHTP